MLNIIVPTDFSPLSRIAIRYAVGLGNKMDGGVTLVHVITNVVEPTTARMQALAEKVEKELLQTAEADLREFTAEVSKQFKSKRDIQYKVIMGQSFDDALLRFAKKSKADMLVMGTRGASGLKKVVLGSNTTSVIEKSSIPVLVVPEAAAFKSFKNLVLATDLKYLETELSKLKPFLQSFEPTLHVLHITAKEKEVESITAGIKNSLKTFGYRKSKATVHIGNDVTAAINAFVGDGEQDVLAMFTHEYGFFDKVFNRSITKRMAFHSTVPLLAMKLK